MMMKRTFQIHTYILCILLAGMYSCRQEEIGPDGGQLNITLADAPTHPTRSLPFALDEELAKSFRLRITGHNGIRYYDGTLEQYNAGAAPALRPDEYLLQAEYGENPAVALDAPYYISEQTAATVTAHTTTDVELVCRVGNSLASFAFADPELAGRTFQAYEFVTQAGGQTVSCTADDGHNPYFKAGSTVDFYLRGTTADGIAVDHKFASISAAEKQKNYKYTLILGEGPKGDGTLDITVDANVETVSVNETVPQAWLPKPQQSNEGFDASGSLYYRETTDAVTARINYQALMPVEDVEFELDFDDPNLYVLNKTYRLSELTEEERSALAAAGIALPELRTETGTMDFTQMTGRLLSTKSGENARNIINVRVYANHRWSEQKKYVIYAQRPEFNVTVSPGGIWTKEFTVNPMQETDVIAGKLENIQKELSYQYSLDEKTWFTIPETRRQTGLTPKTKYFVRAVYRGGIYSSPIQLTTYDNLQIPNSSLDNGYDITNPKNNNPLYTFKENWIGTRNPMTCHSKGVNAFYVSKSGTIPIEDNGSTVAEMSTIGWGEGNTCSFGNKTGSIINNISAGLICVGDFDSSNNTVSAKAAAIRPTALRFTYKANPYNGDEYLVRIYLENHTNDETYTIGNATLQSSNTQNSYTTISLPITYDEQYNDLYITHVKIEFYSGTKEDRDHLENKFRDASVWDGYSNAYIIGSQFWLDEFSLIYDK